MKTVHDQWLEDDNTAEDGYYIQLESFVGRKVRHVVYGTYNAGNIGDSWSEQVYEINGFIDNTCGDGCCNGFTIDDGQKNLVWRSDQLLLVL